MVIIPERDFANDPNALLTAVACYPGAPLHGGVWNWVWRWTQQHHSDKDSVVWWRIARRVNRHFHRWAERRARRRAAQAP